jgi:acetyl-CoA C-acetyltransferase
MTRRVILAGWGQITQGKHQREGLLDPMGLMAEAARRAGVQEIIDRLDGVMVVRVMSRHTGSAARRLAQELGAAPRLAEVSGIGGSSPQLLINRAAGLIARGELGAVLIAGGETYYPRDEEAVRGADSLFKGFHGGGGGGHERDDMIGSSEVERRHGVILPLQGFPLFETALWAESGEPLDRHLEGVARLWSGFSQAAASHPAAWIRTPRAAEEIARPSPSNRPVAFPYSKFMTSLITVDMGAAVILASEELGPLLRAQGARPVYFLGGAYGEDRQRFPIERTSFTRSEALGNIARRALRRSGLELDSIDAFDLYSCFPCAVAIAQRELGLAGDPRPLTVTGGLGFFGGPGNNYSLHAIVTLAEAIARGELENGLVTGLGWFLHKHAAGVYGAEPPATNLASDDLLDRASPLVGREPVPWVERAEGEGVIETYTVLFDREGAPQKAIIYGRDAEERRFVALGRPEARIEEALIAECQVGRTVNLGHDDRAGLNHAELG